jgi:AHBA synthesis associated protein
MLIIFDMDFTLVDTTEPERLRKLRMWGAAAGKLEETEAYDGIQEVISELKSDGHDLVVLTNSPSRDAKKLTQIHDLKIDAVFYYKDLGVPPKPRPDGHRELLRRYGFKELQAVSVGDKASDREAAHGAGVRFVAAMWGASEESVADGADAVAISPNQLLDIIKVF